MPQYVRLYAVIPFLSNVKRLKYVLVHVLQMQIVQQDVHVCLPSSVIKGVVALIKHVH